MRGVAKDEPGGMPARMIPVLILLLAAMAALRPVPAGAESPQPFLGHQAPDFELVDLEGRRVSLAELRGKPVFLNFWATWCLPCREEMPAIQKIAAGPLGKEMVIVGINLQESPQVVREFVQKHGFTWIFLLDQDGRVADRYRIRFVPTSFFLDPEGRIRARYSGPLTEAGIRAYYELARGGRGGR